MKNQTNGGKNAELHAPQFLSPHDERDIAAQPEAESLWQRSKQAVCLWLGWAERRVTEGFRVPPGGG